MSKLNDDFYEASFEVYYMFVSQILLILGFLYKIFSHFDLCHIWNLLRLSKLIEVLDIMAQMQQYTIF